MTITVTNKHIDITDSGYCTLPTISPGIYTTNLLYYNWNSGELAPALISCGAKGGWSFQFSDKSKKKFSYSDINRLYYGTSVIIFESTKLQEFLPHIIKSTAEYVTTYSKLLAKAKDRLTHLEQLASNHPEAFV